MKVSPLYGRLLKTGEVLDFNDSLHGQQWVVHYWVGLQHKVVTSVNVPLNKTDEPTDD